MSNKFFAVLGDPIEHSLSPKIHAAAYKQLGLDYSYQAVRVSAGALKEFIHAEGSLFSGFSVTMPLKFEAADLAKESDLQGTGVCNTLIRDGVSFSGYNTDVFGIQQAVRFATQEEMGNVAILGSGATARSALIAAQGISGTEMVTVYARDLDKAAALKDLLTKEQIAFESRILEDYSGNQDLTINTLPAGIANSLVIENPVSGWLLSAGYSELDEAFITNFEPGHVISGTEMLLWQAVRQVLLFAGSDLACSALDEASLVEIMRQAL